MSALRNGHFHLQQKRFVWSISGKTREVKTCKPSFTKISQIDWSTKIWKVSSCLQSIVMVLVVPNASLNGRLTRERSIVILPFFASNEAWKGVCFRHRKISESSRDCQVKTSNVIHSDSASFLLPKAFKAPSSPATGVAFWRKTSNSVIGVWYNRFCLIDTSLRGSDNVPNFVHQLDTLIRVNRPSPHLIPVHLVRWWLDWHKGQTLHPDFESVVDWLRWHCLHQIVRLQRRYSDKCFDKQVFFCHSLGTKNRTGCSLIKTRFGHSTI